MPVIVVIRRCPVPAAILRLQRRVVPLNAGIQVRDNDTFTRNAIRPNIRDTDMGQVPFRPTPRHIVHVSQRLFIDEIIGTVFTNRRNHRMVDRFQKHVRRSVPNQNHILNMKALDIRILQPQLSDHLWLSSFSNVNQLLENIHSFVFFALELFGAGYIRLFGQDNEKLGDTFILHLSYNRCRNIFE